MLTGENGIINRAVEARERTERASLVEQAQTDIMLLQVENTSTNLTKEQLDSILEKYFETVPDDYTIDTVLTTKEEYGKYEIAISEIYGGEIEEKITIPEGLEIGSIVSYNPDGTYSIDERYSGSADNPDVLDSSTDEFNIDTWKVFDINETTGEITLVPISSTDNAGGYVYLQGAQGYNNAVYLLDEACSKLYGDEEKGITARSIDMDDIEGKMTEEALEEAHSYTNSSSGARYGEQIENAYSQSNSYYPSIYEQEALREINGTYSATGLGMSDKVSGLIEPDANGGTNGYLQGTSIRPTQTYWNGDNSFMQTAFETSNNGVNYYNLLMLDGDSTYYWVASRCVSAYSSSCNFYVRFVNGGHVHANCMFSSFEGSSLDYYGLFPVVTLSSELIDGNAEEGFVVQ